MKQRFGVVPPQLFGAGSRAYVLGLPLLVLVLAFMATLAFRPTPCLAAPPQRLIVENARLAPHGGTLLFSCAVSVDEESGLHDLLKDGAVLELAVTLTLDRHRTWWTNSEVTSITYTSILRHDPLTRDFIVARTTAKGEELTRDRNLTRLLYSSWKKLEFAVVPMETFHELGTDRDYILQADISLRHTEVPPWLQNTVGFWSSSVVPSEEITLEFHY